MNLLQRHSYRIELNDLKYDIVAPPVGSNLVPGEQFLRV